MSEIDVVSFDLRLPLQSEVSPNSRQSLCVRCQGLAFDAYNKQSFVYLIPGEINHSNLKNGTKPES